MHLALSINVLESPFTSVSSPIKQGNRSLCLGRWQTPLQARPGHLPLATLWALEEGKPLNYLLVCIAWAPRQPVHVLPEFPGTTLESFSSSSLLRCWFHVSSSPSLCSRHSELSQHLSLQCSLTSRCLVPTLGPRKSQPSPYQAHIHLTWLLWLNQQKHMGSSNLLSRAHRGLGSLV